MRAVIFDLSGTLLDVREGIFWQYEQLTREFDGAPASRKEIAEAMHGTTDEVIRTLVKNESVPLKEIASRHEELRLESLKHVQLYPGVGELLPILRRVGARLAAVTSDSTRSIEVLEAMGIAKHFDIVITSEHVSNLKPHPEGVLRALEHLSIPAHDAAMVGDTTGDIIAGKKANLAKTIAVTHGFGFSDDLQEANPDHLIDDIPSLLDVLDARVEA